jgi:hypothetical protein
MDEQGQGSQARSSATFPQLIIVYEYKCYNYWTK